MTYKDMGSYESSPPCTRHFRVIEFDFMETNQSVGSYANMIYMREMCAQRSNIAAGSKHRALAFYFPHTNLPYVLNIKM